MPSLFLPKVKKEDTGINIEIIIICVCINKYTKAYSLAYLKKKVLGLLSKILFIGKEFCYYRTYIKSYKFY